MSECVCFSILTLDEIDREYRKLGDQIKNIYWFMSANENPDSFSFKVSEEEIKSMVSSLADRIYTYAYFLTEFCKDLGDGKRERAKDEHFFFTMLLKAANELTAVAVLFKNFYEKAALQSGMYLILRTVLSDCLTGWHVLRMFERKENHEHLIDLIYFDHVCFSIRGLSGSYNQINRLAPQDLAAQIQFIKSVNPDFFHTTVNNNGETIYGKDKFNGESYSLKKSITYLTQQKLSLEERGLLTHLFYYYDLFSKFEHPGLMTFMLVHKSFNPKLQARSINDAVDAVLAIEAVVYRYLEIWPELLQNATDFENTLKNLHLEARSLIAALNLKPFEWQ